MEGYGNRNDQWDQNWKVETSKEFRKVGRGGRDKLEIFYEGPKGNYSTKLYMLSAFKIVDRCIFIGGVWWDADMITQYQLISRTWKGIPDCWRAAAWHAFLTSSAEKKGNCLPDDELRAIYSVCSK